MKKQSVVRGFSLIELLLVISIIGVLATFVSINYIGITKRSRDSQRKADVKKIQVALELFRSEQGRYPTIAEFPACPNPLRSPDASVTYMDRTPCDPSGPTYYYGGRYYYESLSANQRYELGACMQDENDPDPQTTTLSPGGSGCATGEYYVVNNP